MAKPGSFINPDEIKIAIIYALQAAEKPLTIIQISEILMENGLAEYFDISENLHDLLLKGHVDRVKESDLELYKASVLGRETIGLLKQQIPSSAREKIQRSVLKQSAKEQSDAQNRCEIAPDGTSLRLIIMENKVDSLLELQVTVANRLQAEMICRKFRNNPTAFYQSIIGLLID
jgi:predicted nucleotidyltransferase